MSEQHESVPPSIFPNIDKPPVYLYDTNCKPFFSPRCRSLRKIDSTSIIEEDDLFTPSESVSWDTPLVDLFDRIPYGILLQHVFHLYEIGIIDTVEFYDILIGQLTHFYRNVSDVAMDGSMNLKVIRAQINSLLKTLHITNDFITNKIIFNLKQNNDTNLNQNVIMNNTSERMKQLASIYDAKKKGRSCQPVSLCKTCSKYRDDQEKRYNVANYGSFIDENEEYSQLKNIKQSLVQVYSVTDPFNTANIWQIITNLFGVNDPNEIGLVAEIAEREMVEAVPDIPDALYEIPSVQKMMTVSEEVVEPELEPEIDNVTVVEPELEPEIDNVTVLEGELEPEIDNVTVVEGELEPEIDNVTVLEGELEPEIDNVTVLEGELEPEIDNVTVLEGELEPEIDNVTVLEGELEPELDNVTVVEAEFEPEIDNVTVVEAEFEPELDNVTVEPEETPSTFSFPTFGMGEEPEEELDNVTVEPSNVSSTFSFPIFGMEEEPEEELDNVTVEPSNVSTDVSFPTFGMEEELDNVTVEPSNVTSDVTFPTFGTEEVQPDNVTVEPSNVTSDVTFPTFGTEEAKPANVTVDTLTPPTKEPTKNDIHDEKDLIEGDIIDEDDEELPGYLRKAPTEIRTIYQTPETNTYLNRLINVSMKPVVRQTRFMGTTSDSFIRSGERGKENITSDFVIPSRPSMEDSTILTDEQKSAMQKLVENVTVETPAQEQAIKEGIIVPLEKDTVIDAADIVVTSIGEQIKSDIDTKFNGDETVFTMQSKPGFQSDKVGYI